MNHNELLIPNHHVALIHFPLALLVIGVLAELVCAVAYRQSGARVAARWMILLGAALGWPSLYSGIYALRDVSIAGAPDLAYAPWGQLRVESPNLSAPATWEALRSHLLIAAGSIAVANLVVVGWLMAGATLRRVAYIPALALLLLSCAGIVVSAWHAGEIVYYHDITRVADSPGLSGETPREVPMTVRAVVPPLQSHVSAAGLVTGLALLAWGVAARPRPTRGAAHLQTQAQSPSQWQSQSQSSDTTTSPRESHSDRATASAERDLLSTPPATLGWLTLLAVLITAALGWWSLADSFETWQPIELLKAMLDTDNRAGPLSRRFAHAMVAVAIGVLAVLVALAGRRSHRGRALPLVIGSLLLTALLAQTWLGMLLLLDTNAGSIVLPNPAE